MFVPSQISALREAALAREMHDAGLPDLKWLYMGEPKAYVHFSSEYDLIFKAFISIPARRVDTRASTTLHSSSIR